MHFKFPSLSHIHTHMLFPQYVIESPFVWSFIFATLHAEEEERPSMVFAFVGKLLGKGRGIMATMEAFDEAFCSASGRCQESQHTRIYVYHKVTTCLGNYLATWLMR